MLTAKQSERFWAKVRVNRETGCWEWTASCSGSGYGQYWAGRVKWAAHRLAYTEQIGGIPKGQDLDHLCRVRRCVNPRHLEPVGRQENVRRGMLAVARGGEANKTHCAQGHEFTPANIYERPDGRRDCLLCRRIRSAASRKAA
jgi:hypothetical protein